MNLQAKRSVFRSRKSRQKKHANRGDLATTFLAQLMATKNAKRLAKQSSHSAEPVR